ncbi:MAG TPA: glycosyltransferase family 39 protein [Dehalococcoidia bacterium]|nr:glycosyltransferase family 39 protein [Dehalococcoidia bacterium]
MTSETQERPPAPASTGASWRARIDPRAALAPALALAGLGVALLSQFGITRGLGFPHPAYGFIPAALLFASAGFVLWRRGAGREIAGLDGGGLALGWSPWRRWELIAAALVLAIAIFFRFYRLLGFPQGLWYDEGIIGTDALSIIDGDHFTVWRDTNFGRASLYPYLMVFTFKTFGYTLFAFRIVPALAGLGAVIAFYFLARWLLGPAPALVATALLAVSRWAVTFSRISWDAAMVPLFSVMAVYFLVRGLEKKERLSFFLAGGSLAAGIYTYPSFRLMPAVMALYLAYIAATQWPLVRRNVPGIVLYAVSFAVVIFPLAQFALTHQDQFLRRTREVSVFRQIDREHSWEPLKHNIRASFEMMNAHGDPNGRHNLPGAPMLDEVSAALLVLGLVVCAWSLRNWRRGALVPWLVLALLPGALTLSIENPSAIRGVGALPPLYLIVGLAVAFLHRTLTPTRAGSAVFAVVAVALVGTSAGLNYHQFFEEQAKNRDVFEGFQPGYTITARAAAAQAGDRTTYVAREYNGHPAFRVLTRGKQVSDYVPANRVILPDAQRDAFIVLDPREDAILPTLHLLYPHADVRVVDDQFGQPVYDRIVVPASDIDALHRLPMTLYRGDDLSAPPLRESEDLVGRAWSQDDLRDGPVTAVWRGFVWISTAPGNVSFSLTGPGSLRVRVDGKEVAAGDRQLTMGEPITLPIGEHSVEIIAAIPAPGETSARVALDSAAEDASHVLYDRTLGDRGFQALYRNVRDFSVAPVLQGRVPFAVATLPSGMQATEYRGILDVSEAGEYGFAVEGSPSAQIFVDDQLVADNGGSHPPRRVEGTVDLGAGEHLFSLQYTVPDRPEFALYLKRPGGDWKLVDGSEFRPPSGAFVPPSLVSLVPDPAWGAGGRTFDGLEQPLGVAAAPDGTIVTASREKLFLIAPDGSARSVSLPAEIIGDVAVAGDGRIAALDRNRHSLFVLDREGNVLQRFEGAFPSAFGVAVRGDDAYVSSPSGGGVFRVPLGGGNVEKLPISDAPPERKALQPSDVAVADDGTIFLADFDGKRIVVSPDGAASTTFRGVAGTGTQVPSIAVYRQLLFVTDPLNQRIVIYDRAGKQRGQFSFTTIKSGVRPTGIAVTDDGVVYVSDPESGAIYRLTVQVPADLQDLVR